MTEEELKNYLTPAQLAERWGVTEGSLANRRSAKKPPSYTKLHDNTVLYNIKDVLDHEKPKVMEAEG